MCATCYEVFLTARSASGFSSKPAALPLTLASNRAPGSAMEDVFACLDESISLLPTIPRVPQQVIAAIQDPGTTSEDLALMINEDAALTMRVLKLANSVAFGSRQPTSDLKLACSRLGMRNLTNIAQVVAHAHLFRVGNPAFETLMCRQWEHAVATARLAEVLALPSGGVLPRTVFLSGLVHDIGKTVLLDAITTPRAGAASRFVEDLEMLGHILDEFAPYAGLRVAQHWMLPVEVRFSTYYSRYPLSAPETFRSQTIFVALASDIAELSGYGITGKPLHDIDELAAALTNETAPVELLERASAEVDPFLAAARS